MMKNFSVMFSVVLLLTSCLTASIAFTTITQTTTTASAISSSELKMMNWEDIMFNAQSTASSMASTSLDDPSNIASSIPIMYGAGLLTGIYTL